MTDADGVMNPQHFGSNPADIWSNPEILIRILDQFWLLLVVLVEVCVL